LEAVDVRLAFVGIVLVLAPGCGGEPPKAPPVMRPIDEPHAVSIIMRVFRELGVDPERNRIIHFGDNASELRLDVAAKGKQFGIAYITWQDADKLGDALPRRRDPDTLIVVRGIGEDADARAVLLYAGDYMQDDLSGEEHTSTTIAAEGKLERDAKDVVRKALHEGWP
jgi:hypothetical protein